jgi:hypothetical protein
VPKLLAVPLAVLALCAVVAASASAQTVTRGSTLQNAPNYGFGCEAAVETDFGSGLILPNPFYNLPSCSWYGTGSAGVTGDQRSSAVTQTGIVTNVRVRSGPNPAPLRVSVIRSISSLTLNPDAPGGCCFGQRESAVFQPTPNAVTQVAVNLPVENVRDVSRNISWYDSIGISAAGGTGSLPISDQGPASHQIEAAFNPNVLLSAMTGPKIEPDNTPRLNFRGAPGYDVLLQYDLVPCATTPTGQPLPGCGAPPPGAPAPTSPAVPTAATPAPVPTPPRAAPPPRAATIGGQPTIRFRGTQVPVPVECAASRECVGVLRLLAAADARAAQRGRRATVLASARVRIPAGASRTVRARLTRAGRRAVRRGRRVRVRAVLDLGAGGLVERRLTLRRR